MSDERWHEFDVLLSVRFALKDTEKLALKRAQFIVGKTEVWKLDNLSVAAKVLKVKPGIVREI